MAPLLTCLACTALPQPLPNPQPPALRSDWPTLRGDPQRTGFYSHFPNGPLRLAWRKELWRELTGPRTEIIVGNGLAFLGTYAGNLYAWHVETGTADDIRAEQEFIVRFLQDRPEEQTFYAFHLDTGEEPWIAPILYVGGLHNPPSPPCVNPHTGDVFVQLRSAYGVWDGGGEVRSYTTIGRLNLDSGRVNLIEHGHASRDPGRPAGQKDMPWMTFAIIGDETQTLACSPDRLFSIHQGFIGSMHFDTGLTASLYGKRDTYGGFYGPGTFGWEQQGGLERAQAADQPFGIVNEWHGPARAIVSVAGNRVFFPVGSQILCLEPAP